MTTEAPTLSELTSVLADDGRIARPPRRSIPVEIRLELYRHMRRLRRLDTRLSALQRQGRIGFYGAAFGQEAPPVAAALAAAPTDWVFPALREGAVLLVRGLPLVTYLAQLFGNARDPLKGRQMPNHVASRSVKVVSWSSCIATQLPHAVGAALAATKLGSDGVVLAFLGDGATSHPDFHAALNFAGVFRAPVVFVCQNNQYAISVSASRQTASSTFAIKASAYGVRGERLDGNDALAVYDAVAHAIDGARAGNGATLLECVTYRLGAHSSSDDPSRYRSAAEEARWRERDPVQRLGRHLEREGVGSSARDCEIDTALDAELERALAEVEGEPRPALETLFDDVYARLPWHLVEQRAALGGTAAERAARGR
ncbi:MAG TPA: thiamine pyrophosphate-dependent enzyme [Polyangiaceae bacterium]|nr:thiamine pyrophosphate-dependent enzyme [Polyangiaceae bacterium]